MAIDKRLLGKAIRQVRQLRGISQSTLAEEAGLRGNSVALIERGQRGVSIDTLNALAEVLEVPAACLVMLGTSKIAGDSESAALVKSLQKLIVATVVAQATLQAKEQASNANEKQIRKAMRSIPQSETVEKKFAGNQRRTARKKKPAKAKSRQKLERA